MIDKIENLIEQVKELNSRMKHLGEVLGSMWHYATHPLELALIIWQEAVKYSFYICIMVFLIGTIFYLTGFKKGAKWARISIFSYVTIQIFYMVCR